LSGRAAAASSSRRAWATSNRKGRRAAVSRRRVRCHGDASRRCWVTAQSRKQPRTPTRWLKLRARGLGLEARQVLSIETTTVEDYQSQRRAHRYHRGLSAGQRSHPPAPNRQPELRSHSPPRRSPHPHHWPRRQSEVLKAIRLKESRHRL